MKLKANVEKGKLTLDDIFAFKAELSRLEGKSITVELKQQRKARSGNQNRYYWLIVIGLISESTGYTPDECHELLKQIFNGVSRDIAGATYLIPQTTTKLNTKEWEDYMSLIRTWASAELGLFIPCPNSDVIEY